MLKRASNINSNVKLAFIFTILQSLGRGIWMGNIFSLYIILFVEEGGGMFGLSGNALLGLTAGVSGIAMTAIVFPAGIFTDKHERQVMLRIAGIVGVAAMIFLSAASSLSLIFLAMLLWGAFQGMSRPAFESIVADSLKTGKRSGIYAKIHLVRQIGMASGPFLNVILFLFLGDKW